MGATGQEQFSDRLRHGEPMAKHTSWRTGGKAETWFRPANRDELLSFMQTLDTRTPVHMIGLGSNLLVRDGGVQGVVIALQDALNEIHYEGEGRVTAEAGVPFIEVTLCDNRIVTDDEKT